MKKHPKSVYRKRRIFLDTNVILDFFLEREPFYYDAFKTRHVVWYNETLRYIDG